MNTRKLGSRLQKKIETYLPYKDIITPKRVGWCMQPGLNLQWLSHGNISRYKKTTYKNIKLKTQVATAHMQGINVAFITPCRVENKETLCDLI